MAVQRVFLTSKTEAPITCMQCGVTRKVDVSRFDDVSKPLRVKCACGHVFSVIVDKRLYYRKPTNLKGYFYLKDGLDPKPCVMTVENLSRTGLAIRLDDCYAVKEGDILKVEFALDNDRKSVIRNSVVVRSIKGGGLIGAEFLNLDEHTRKELGFYLMP